MGNVPNVRSLSTHIDPLTAWSLTVKRVKCKILSYVMLKVAKRAGMMGKHMMNRLREEGHRTPKCDV